MNKTIWILWVQGYDNAPSIVKKCITSWVTQNPDWQVNVLDRQTVGHYVDIDMPKETLDKLSLNHFSDVLRVALLSQHGGVWADATLYCRQPLNSWLTERMNSGFFAFSRENEKRVSSCWFLAATANNPIPVKLNRAMKTYWLTYRRFTYVKPRVKLWRKAQKTIPRFLLNHKKRNNLLIKIIQRKELYPPYFLINDLFSDFLKHDETFRNVWDKTPIYSAADPLLVARIGYRSIINEQNKRLIEASSAPLFKLTWKAEYIEPNPESVIAYMHSIMPRVQPEI